MHFDRVLLRNLCEEGAELEETDEGGKLLMVLRVGSTCLIYLSLTAFEVQIPSKPSASSPLAQG